MDASTSAYTFEFSRSEHVRACRAIHRYSIHRRWARWLLRAGYGLMVLLVLVAVLSGRLTREQFPAMLPVFVALALYPSVITLSSYLQARQWEKLNPAGNRTVTITVSEDSFRSASYVGATDVRWAAVKQVVETPEFLLVYVTERIAHYLPKRAIPDGELPLARRLLRSRVDARRVHIVADATSSAATGRG